MEKISIVLCGPSYKEYSIEYAIRILRSAFKDCEIIISTNDKNFPISKEVYIDKIVYSENIGELPSLKFPIDNEKIVNNNINKQIQCCLSGISEANNELVLRLRTDQLVLDNSILDIWSMIKNIPHSTTHKRGRIITSSIFSINPRYSERMPYHISDMLQFGYKKDLISYFSAPPYPFEYATWYERNPHHPSSNKYERSFRSKFAVEQWLAMHYMFDDEHNFPISYHNECSNDIIERFESLLSEYFVIAHPDDIHLRASKFSSSESYYNTQCYSTKESIMLIAKKHPEAKKLVKLFAQKGINKTFFTKLMPIIYSPVVQFIIKYLSTENKMRIKGLLNKLSK
ncbi:WavE lipopolysaccharide synthesis family protein [Kluyvera ascorbata]|uniref:WavE lipopolysaccharide synthesis family protein n=1 Tax=Kluyvera ascorbata TaxID=51288 RepID=UPI003569A761